MSDSRFIDAKERERRIMGLLKIRGWSIYKWADMMGVHRVQAARAMRAENVTLETIKKMATALGCPAGFLIDRDYKRGK